LQPLFGWQRRISLWFELSPLMACTPKPRQGIFSVWRSVIQTFSQLMLSQPAEKPQTLPNLNQDIRYTDRNLPFFERRILSSNSGDTWCPNSFSLSIAHFLQHPYPAWELLFSGIWFSQLSGRHSFTPLQAW
jgi:hypothetical protein